MTKCVKCGGDITEGAKFCSYCGTPVESGSAKDETKERTQVFVDTIRKCPNCGEQIGTNATKCPACGFVIEKRNVSASLDDFVKKLASFDHYAKKREYIENYPVPNNKEDIRDLLTYAASQRDKDYDDNVAKAYWVDVWNNKCRQIVNQAFDTFGMDEDFASWLRNYKAGVEISSTENEKLKKKLRSIEKGKNRAAGAKKFFKAFGIIVVILAVLGGAGFGIRSFLNKKAAEKLDFEKEIAELNKIALKGYTIPKENVSLAGILATYCEVVGDAKVSMNILQAGKYDDWRLTATISVPIKMKKDFSLSYKKQKEALLKGNLSSEFREYRVTAYNDAVLTDITQYSFGESNIKSTTLFRLVSCKLGDTLDLVAYGEIIDLDRKVKAKVFYEDVRNKLDNPADTITFYMKPQLCRERIIRETDDEDVTDEDDVWVDIY